MIRRFVPLFLASVIAACGGDTVTSPTSPMPTGSGGAVSVSNPPAQPSPAPTPPSGETTAYIEFDKVKLDGSGQFCNPLSGSHAVTITYTAPLDLNTIYGFNTYIAEPGKCVKIPSALQALGNKLKCGSVIPLQVDANAGMVSLAGQHIGHVFIDVKTDTCCVDGWTTLSEKVEYGEWGACEKLENGCFQTRTKTATFVEKNNCTGETRTRVISGTVNQPCECACVAEWKELEPEIIYSSWTECSKGENGCFQSRAVKTVIKEKNSCTGEIRLKSETFSTEKKECACICEPTYTTREEITYTPWSKGECGTRTKTVKTYQKNSCTNEEKLIDTQVFTETKECPSACLTTKATSNAINPFEIANAGDATELAWVNANVSPGPYAILAKVKYVEACALSQYAAPVILVKAANTYVYFLNVVVGQNICPNILNKNGKPQAISHITYFTCKED